MGRTQINSDLIKNGDIQTDDLSNNSVTVEKININGNLSLNGNQLKNIGNLSEQYDGVNKSYVDSKFFDLKDSTYRNVNGIWINGLNAGETLVNYELVYFDYNTNTWKKADYSNINTIAIGISPNYVTSGNQAIILTYGLIQINISYPPFTGMSPGDLLYLSSNGAFTNTTPSATGKQVQIIGKILSSNMVLFNPSLVTAEVA